MKTLKITSLENLYVYMVLKINNVYSYVHYIQELKRVESEYHEEEIAN